MHFPYLIILSKLRWFARGAFMSGFFWHSAALFNIFIDMVSNSTFSLPPWVLGLPIHLWCWSQLLVEIPLLLFVWFRESIDAWLFPWIYQSWGEFGILFLTGYSLVEPLPWIFIQGKFLWSYLWYFLVFNIPFYYLFFVDRGLFV